MSRGFRWLVALAALICFSVSVVAIIAIRSTWHDEDRREIGAVWLYALSVLIFITALLAGISAEITPDVCKMPYSGRFARYS